MTEPNEKFKEIIRELKKESRLEKIVLYIILGLDIAAFILRRLGH